MIPTILTTFDCAGFGVEPFPSSTVDMLLVIQMVGLVGFMTAHYKLKFIVCSCAMILITAYATAVRKSATEMGLDKFQALFDAFWWLYASSTLFLIYASTEIIKVTNW